MPAPRATTLAKFLRFRRIGLRTASFTLIGSTLIHTATFVPGVSVSMAVAWPFHLLAMASFGLALFTGSIGRRRAQPDSILDSFRQSRSMGCAIVSLPVWVLAVCLVVVAYACVNFQRFHGVGTPLKSDDGYVVLEKGHSKRISEAEFDRLQALTVRGFSGHWIVFSLLSLVGLVYLVQPPSISGQPSDHEPKLEES
jgi:hypothetical protein